MAVAPPPPPQWITTQECSASFIQSKTITHWLTFIFFSPCPQRILFSSIDLLFLFTLIPLSAIKLSSRFTSKPNSTLVNQPLLRSQSQSQSQSNASTVTVNLSFTLSLLLTAFLTISSSVFCLLAFIHRGGNSSPWETIEALFWLAQVVTYAAIALLLIQSKKLEALVHPLALRVYWVASFVLVSLLSVSAIARLITKTFDSAPNPLKIDDVFTLVNLPISLFFFVIAIRGSTGVIPFKESRNTENNVTGYATAPLFSRGIWLWMNPLLAKGYKTPLDINDVPSLSPEHKAEKMAELFERNWPKSGENVNNPLLNTLLKCFWKDIVFIGLIALLRLAVMYIGPMLIQSFIDVTSGKSSSWYEGYLLILILLVAKTIEALSSHQYNFQSQKLGMLIRSSLITSLFKKGLRLSNSSRQDHGVGQIVNYMSVDCQQLADMMLQLHPIWMMPFQVGIALVLLYGYLGVAAFVSLVAVVLCFGFSLWITQRNNRFMFNVMMGRDSRMKATNELISNMRVIKFQAWEEHFNRRIQGFREAEYSWLGKFMYSICSNMILLGSLPVLITAISFAVALGFGVKLDAATVFTATTIFKIVQEPIMTFPQALITISQALVSLKRVNGYMTSREIVRGFEDGVEHKYDDGSRVAVEVVNGSFSWDDQGDEKVLEDVNFRVEKGELVTIVGTVGSGKSSLLASVLGEMHKISGKVRVCGSTAYVSQTSWIQNATIQENILFGSPLNAKRYKEAVRVCCLEKDLEMMEHGDQTEIGERGINLSGGQKQRIQLARAVYQDSDIYLLDDVFSAVDAHTGSEIFKECVRGVLKNKTVLLVTHQLDFLHNANLILVMRDGRIVQSGKYEELLEHGLDFGALVAAHETSMELVEMSSANSKGNSTRSPKPDHSSSIQEETSTENESLERSNSKKGNSKIFEDEEKETGHVSLNVYKQYSVEAFGWFGVFSVLFLSLLWQGSLTTADYWLAYETSDGRFHPSLFINVYWIIVAISVLVLIFRSLLTTAIGLIAAQSFFKQILHSMIHAPMSFFDTTPSGRILSRASTDQSNVDIMIPMYFNIAIVMYFSVLGIVFVTCLNAWPTIFLVIPLAWLNIWYREYFLTTSRELTRLDSITKAPVIHHFSETVSGVMTICCFKKQDHFVRGNIERVNLNLRMDFHNNAANEWLGFRLEMIGNFILCAATMFMVLLPGAVISPEYVGLTLSYGLPLNAVLFTAVFTSCFVENKMVSVERIKQFIHIPSEAPWTIEKTRPSPEWPTRGDIEIKSLQVRYRPNTPLVLKGITLSIRGGEKTGVVGRTGSGKSTLIQVFFRLVEPSGGSIVIDGVNICDLGLHDLRSRFGIIPQDPVLFQGTIRSNIDPVGLYTDDEIWKSLERCQLKDVVASKPEKLYASVTDTGDNWSVGQRQLLCLGRVMLKHSRILFMDEATASVDSQTDTLIQKIIREDFSDCTIITIAHRIPTVIDCDRVLVMDDGLAKEFDSPTKLMERPSLFAALVQEYANRSTGV